MSDTLSRPIQMNVEVTDTQIVPIESPEMLNPPYNNVARTETLGGQLNLIYSCTIDIPVEVSLNDVSALQYFAGEKSATLEFYFVYDYDGTLSGANNSYDVILTAITTEAPLVQIGNIYSLIENIDPKTSRGTVTTVKPSETIN